jgi:hypothetical protein
MDKVYQVFVSSTYGDLKDERQKVTNTLAKAGFIAAGMELFPATDQQQLEYINRVIDRSDYYVVIVGGRYGSLAENGLSFTENEFEYARSKDIPVLAFLHRDPSTLAMSKNEDDLEKREKLSAFKKRLTTGRIVEFWDNDSDLCTKVAVAAMNAVNLSPGIGWIRGDQAIDPKVLQETEKLRIENREIKEKLESLGSGEISFDPRYSGPETEIAFNVSLRQRQLGSNVISTFSGSVRVGDAFIELYDILLKAPSETEIRTHIGRFVCRKMNKELGANSTVTGDPAATVLIRNQLEALGLIRTESRTSSDDMKFVAWLATEKGKRFALSRLAQLAS